MNKKILIIAQAVLVLVYLSSSYGQNDSARAKFEALPIISYDTDVGLGYGAKLFLFDQLNTKESFDIILFNSTKGEQWYKIVFSNPDFESRQGKKYSFALDIIAEYDKFSKYYYYYYYNRYFTPDNPILTLTDECKFKKTTIGLFLSKAFLTDFTTTLAFQYKVFSFYDVYRDPNRTEYLPPDNIASTDRFFSIMFNSKWDSRKSYINPKSGMVVALEIEWAPEFEFNSSGLLRSLIAYQYYKEIISKDIILAMRGKAEAILQSGKASIFNMLTIGGNNTVRGLPMDKYRFDSVLLFNNEFRFPIWWRFGGVVGFDLANGSSEDYIGPLDPGWILGGVAGLRFFMDNFIVRADFGFTESDTGFYLNFGHLF